MPALIEHPVVQAFPPMPPDRYAEFLADIRANGIREPITLWRGEQLIDGRHRVRAASELGIDCPRRRYDGDDPIGLAVSLNMKRRDMTAEQRQVAAVYVANLNHGGDRSGHPANRQLAPISRANAARMFNVSERSVNRVAAVRDHAPDLIPAVQQGMVRVAAAEQLARHAPDVVPRIAELYRAAMVRQRNLLPAKLYAEFIMPVNVHIRRRLHACLRPRE